MKPMVLAIFCLLSVTTLGHAQRSDDLLTTGRDFVQQCRTSVPSGKDTVAVGQQMRCIGYVQGFLEGQMAAQALNDGKLGYCLPKKMTFVEFEGATLQEAKANPSLLNSPISVVMEKALLDKFPCTP